ncbi:hypothetical protein AVEN_239387-1 [Araneus ventricosus]|uniref:Integrase catalytic domain-containing protein n=1 Tax=Araneus ventricosus TaxID=182803 RepID=A0A4Y2Q089_ARAVE|nr:hypothetical protein AVEN_239387-1 [Araneus ventricosus]
MKKLYSEFMEEYETLGHMERVVEDELPSDNYYLPHHGVHKSGSTTTPLRVVFNASSPSSNGVSLNDILLKGDVIEDIFELMLRFRQHKFAFTFDVQKMFRQILVAPHQRDYLRILWFEAQLKAEVEQALNLQIDSILMYTDSTISLAWIQTSPHRLKTFVANRVVKIQRLTQNSEWQHVPSNLNPADVLSRGLVTVEIRKRGLLSAAEIQEGEYRLISLVQQVALAEDFANLSNQKQVTSASKLKYLSPLLDTSSNVIRVGGRLHNSDLSYNVKHPIALPKGHAVSNLVMQDIHIRNVGAQTLLRLTRQNFWPIGGRNLARSIVHNCVICSRYNPQFLSQKMGDLPEERCTPSLPFNITGVDFCGPFYIKNKFQRKGPLQKIYVSIFICYVTRAVHFEIVSDLTSDSFIAALKRFMARRGKISISISKTIFTDNGRNFVGAYNELKRLFKLVSNPDNILAHYFGSEKIHFGTFKSNRRHFKLPSINTSFVRRK